MGWDSQGGLNTAHIYLAQLDGLSILDHLGAACHLVVDTANDCDACTTSSSEAGLLV